MKKLPKTRYALLFLAAVISITACTQSNISIGTITPSPESRIKPQGEDLRDVQAKIKATAQALEDAALRIIPQPTVQPSPTSTPISTPTVIPSEQTIPTATSTPQTSISELVEMLQPSIVQIKTSIGIGAGFIIDENGLILTNAQILGGQINAEVTMNNGLKLSGKVIGSDKTAGIGLLVVNGYQLPALDIETSGEPKIGDSIFALGYNTTTTNQPTEKEGFLQAKQVEAFGSNTGLESNLILSETYSGGPLFNRSGQVIGVNIIGIVSKTGSSFASPINTVSSFVTSLQKGQMAQPFESKKYPLILDLPVEWRLHELGANYLFLRDTNSTATMTIKMISVAPNISTEQFALAQTNYTQAISSSNANKLLSTDSLSRSTTTISEIQTWSSKKTWNNPILDFSEAGTDYFFVLEGTGYTISTRSELSESNVAMSDFNKIINDATIKKAISATPTITVPPTAPKVNYGPKMGLIRHEQNNNAHDLFLSQTDIRNTVIEANLTPPHALFDPAIGWSTGITFRYSGIKENHTLVIGNIPNQGPMWYHYAWDEKTQTQKLIRSKTSEHIQTSYGSSNHILLISLNKTGWLFINKRFIDTLDLSGLQNSGDTGIIGAFFDGHKYIDASTEFNDFTVRSLQSKYEQQEGTIPHTQDGKIDSFVPNIVLTNALVQADFSSPFDPREGRWSPGFLVRNTDLEHYHSFGIRSNGYWFHEYKIGSDETQVRSYGYSPWIKKNNHVLGIFLEEKAWLFVNGEYVTRLNLVGSLDAGQITLFVNYFKGHGKPNHTTYYEDFEIWSIGNE
ncbi:MAG: serine protease [SAR202 cluster bacterium]|nr:serine protease [SAR202 cluster bacterium]|tara:strand:+ start:821 stop:3208 length:2388 start_codon:yes stop_codon:yes gene_type:complete